MSTPLPSRKRSLFLRGYDRPPVADDDSKAKPRSKARRAVSILAVCVVLFGFAFMFSLGLRVSRQAAMRGTVPYLDNSRAVNIDVENRKPPPAAGKRLKVAVAITVTKDGPYLDGAAVLQHSIRMTKSVHEIEMVAIVHSGVQSTRPALAKLGFRIMEFVPPIESKDIQGKHLRETIDKSGCCGAMELLKLCSWMLLDYDRVVAMDMDAVWLANLDHLLERDIPPGGFLFTYDFAMDGRNSRAPPVQGGFQLIRPSKATFDRLVDIVHVGDFRPGTGWGGLNIGWCWGGQTIQGLLSYFANAVEPNLAFPLDPCAYNSMATTKTCRRAEYDLVQTIHYTWCQKPWECHNGAGICAKFLQVWWDVRNDLEKANGLQPVGRCCHMGKEFCPHRTYHTVQVDEMKALPMSTGEGLADGMHIVTLRSDLPLNEGAERV